MLNRVLLILRTEVQKFRLSKPASLPPVTPNWTLDLATAACLATSSCFDASKDLVLRGVTTSPATQGTPRTFDRGRRQETCRQGHDGDADGAMGLPSTFRHLRILCARVTNGLLEITPSFSSQIHAAVDSHSNRTGKRSWPPTDSLRVAGFQS